MIKKSDFTNECILKESGALNDTSTEMKDMLSKLAKVPNRMSAHGQNLGEVSSVILPKGRFAFENDEQDGLNKECAKASIEALRAQEIKTPESGAVANILKKTFQNELKPLEDEVMKPFRATKCYTSSCRNEKSLELLKSWEEKSLSTSGIASPEFAQDLVGILK